MDRLLSRKQAVVAVLFFVTLAGVTGLHINEVDVPKVIKNGTVEFVTLDCDYTLEENEKPGLVVKWYFNNQDYPVYQWIPNQRPQDLGILRGKLNLDFRVSEDTYKMYRALRIKEPNTDLSGKYLCQVSTLFNNAYKSGTMLVYSPQKDMGIKVAGTREPGHVNVSCWASGVFPEPRLTLKYGLGDNADTKVEGLVVHTTQNNGAYDIRAYKIIKETNLSSSSSPSFDCELSIPSTNYTEKRSMQYEPGSLELRYPGMSQNKTTGNDQADSGGVRGFPVGLSGAFLLLVPTALLCLVRTLEPLAGLGPLL